MDVTLLDDLERAGLEPLLKRPDGFGITVLEYSTRYGCSRDIARNILNKAVTERILDMHIMLSLRGGKIAVYHRPGEWPPQGAKMK